KHRHEFQRSSRQNAVFHVAVVRVHTYLIEGGSAFLSLNRLAALAIAAVLAVHGQVDTRMTSSAARMQASIEKQRTAARRQAGGASGQSNGFFTTPWLGAPEAPPSIAAVAQASAGGGATPAACEPISPGEVRTLVSEAAAKEGLNPLLLRAMISHESGGRTCAVSHKGAQGLMQLMPDTAAGLGVEDPFDARANVLGGARYMKQMLERYSGDVRLALAAYNAGPQRVQKDVPGIPETQAYVAAIMAQLGDGDELE
ncbi:MAG TPA: lytic transglycosylase domain-containing protein, partial [Bryobacteraceae bacterium]|nr:lytic transglycosylase domain-containing protein [Bryobacteraceae bacterium]